jgi:sec-independent protein translocase protein TatA
MRISAVHIVVLVVVLILLFGANRLPDLARSVGQSLKIFKSEVKDLREDDTDTSRTPSDTTPSTRTEGDRGTQA